MQKIERKIGDFDDEVFTIDLTKYNKTGTDVQDIIFSVKVNKTDADDTLFLKKLSAGATEMTVEGTTLLTVNVKWPNDEYDQFSTKLKYIAGLFIHFIGDPAADEHVNTLFELSIEQDFLRV